MRSNVIPKSNFNPDECMRNSIGGYSVGTQSNWISHAISTYFPCGCVYCSLRLFSRECKWPERNTPTTYMLRYDIAQALRTHIAESVDSILFEVCLFGWLAFCVAVLFCPPRSAFRLSFSFHLLLIIRIHRQSKRYT